MSYSDVFSATCFRLAVYPPSAEVSLRDLILGQMPHAPPNVFRERPLNPCGLLPSAPEAAGICVSRVQNITSAAVEDPQTAELQCVARDAGIGKARYRRVRSGTERRRREHGADQAETEKASPESPNQVVSAVIAMSDTPSVWCR